MFLIFSIRLHVATLERSVNLLHRFFFFLYLCCLHEQLFFFLRRKGAAKTR